LREEADMKPLPAFRDRVDPEHQLAARLSSYLEWAIQHGAGGNSEGVKKPVSDNLQ
jgi:hypothetical protein